MSDWAKGIEEKAEAARREAEALRLVARDPAFAALPVSTAYWSAKGGVTLVCKVQTRTDAAALFESLNARRPALPVVAYRGTFAGIKPAADWTPRDGDILLDADSALPAWLSVSGFEARHGGPAGETLQATFENATDRIHLRVDIERGEAFARPDVIRDHRGNVIGRVWKWRGLPNSNERFRYARGADNAAPHNWAFAFDISTDLAAWLAGNREG